MKKTNPLESISLIIHTKNEEKNIRDCILSAKGLVKEVIIIDMSSIDKTVKVAKSLGAVVYSIPDKGFVDNFRNYGVSKASYEWILSLDADERLTKRLVDKLSEVVEKNDYDVVMIPFKNIRFGKWLRHTGFWPDYHPRLFKKEYIKWPKNIQQPHIPPKIMGKILTLEASKDNAIVHYNIENVKQLLLKLARYADVKGGGDFFKENKFNSVDLINYYEGEFRWRYIEQRGYMDGMNGFVSSKCREIFKFIEFLKWWESEGYPELFTQEELLRTMLEKNVAESLKEHTLKEFQYSKIFMLWKIYNNQKQKLLHMFMLIKKRK